MLTRVGGGGGWNAHGGGGVTPGGEELMRGYGGFKNISDKKFVEQKRRIKKDHTYNITATNLF